MYKPILGIEKKTFNMKLWLFITPIIFLIFLMGTSQAYLVNFTGSTPISLITSNGISGVQSDYLSANQTFYVMLEKHYVFGTAQNTFMSKWNNDFSVKYIDFTNNWLSCSGSGGGIYANFYLDTTNNRIKWSSDNLFQLCIGNTSLNDFSESLVTENNHLSNPDPTWFFPKIDKGNIIVWHGRRLYSGQPSSNGINYTTQTNLRDSGFSTMGTLTMPEDVTDFYGNDTIRLVYVPTINENWLFYIDQNRKLRMNRYDSNMGYINSFDVMLNDKFPEVINPYYNPSYPDYDVIYSDKYGSVVYLVASIYGNNTVEMQAYDVYGTQQTNNLVLVDDQKINMADYQPSLNLTNNITGLSLTYNPDNAHFYLFYTYNQSSDDSSYSVEVLSESISCQCSAWVDQSECINNQYRKQTRTCVPSGCDSEINYTLDSSCQYVPPPNIANATKFYQNVSSCEIHTSELGKSQKCEFNLNVPSQCQLNTVVVTLSGTILSDNNQKCDQGSWNISLCNPSFSCNNYGHTCNEFNWTHEYTRYTYQANDQALLQVIGIVPTSCGSWYCGFDRVQSWILSADMKVECQIACYNKTICGSGQYFGYSCFERSDCYQESCSFCPLGCMEDTGLCIVAGEQPSTPSGVAPQPSSYTNIFKFLKDTTEFSFADSMWMLNLISIFVTGGSAVFVGIKAQNWVIALIVAMGVALFFLTMGWLPAWIGIVWVLSIALVLTNMFREKIVGK